MKEWLKKLEIYKKCPGCDRNWTDIPKRPDKRYKFVWTKDHKIPLNRGGSDQIDNIQPLCYQCNFGIR
jgi:5-methylcytosine-specific restriction endonuclease McrA